MLPKFQIFTGLLKAYEGDDGAKRFRTTASSTISDLAKDEITIPAIEKMAERAKNNMTIYLNHEYTVPEDVLGSVEDTSMHTRGVDSEGNPIVDLDFDVRLNEANPRALQTYAAIKSGVKLGTSIGALVRSAEKKKGGGLKISDLELLEASIVGIPANPRSWVQYAMKSINSLETDTSSFIIDEDTVLKDVEEAIDKIAAEQSDDVVEKAMCPDCGKGKSAGGDCSNPFHGKAKDITPESTDVDIDKEAARTRVVVTVDSDGTQDAPKSNPEPVLADETADGDDAALGDSVTQSQEEPDLTKATDLVLDEKPSDEVVLERFFATADFATVVTKLQAVVEELTRKELELRKTTVERDEAKENLVVAKEIIDRIADLPVGRQTRFSGAVDDFRKKFPQYDDEFMKFLEK